MYLKMKINNLQNNKIYLYPFIYQQDYFNIFTSYNLPNSFAKIYICLYFSYKTLFNRLSHIRTRFIQLCCRTVSSEIY